MKYVILAITWFVSVLTAFADVPQQINYQGQLTNSSGVPLDTTVSITFNVYGLPSGGVSFWNETHASVNVTDGLFQVSLGSLNPLSDVLFSSGERWLGITVGNNSEMTPRQQVLSAATALRVQTIDAATGGYITGDVRFYDKVSVGHWTNTNEGAAAFVSGQSNHARGDYSVVAGGGNSDPADSNSAGGPWTTIGGGRHNSIVGAQGTISGGNSNVVTWSDATISGGSYNAATGYGAVVSGGLANVASNQYATVSGGISDSASNSFATVGGGNSNLASGYSATVGGGKSSKARGDFSVVAGGGGLSESDSNSAIGYGSTIGGGTGNQATNQSTTVGGGQYCRATGNVATIAGGSSCIASGSIATVGGGHLNQATNTGDVICGGSSNVASGGSSVVSGGFDNYATGYKSCIPGGHGNITRGIACLAAGANARANHDGAFVWGSAGNDVDSTGSFDTYSVTFRCANGARFYTAQSGTATGVSLPAGGGAWANLCDVNEKNLHGGVNTSEVLNKVSSLPLHRWSYKTQDESIQHIGPTAQDFYAAFGLGDNNTTISTLDPDGVALAAIQELAKENVKLQTSNDKLQSELSDLRAMVQSLIADKQESARLERKGK